MQRIPTEDESEKEHRPPFNPLEGCIWPDPDPSFGGPLKLNDVSGLSETCVDSIYFPRNEEDVKRILQHAVARKLKVCARGTQHSMGGHSMVQSGIVVDTKYLNGLQYDSENQLVTTGVGCTWADLIRLLNQYQKSPVTLQSYCSFSVGGTLSVNAHGITTDSTLAESVTQFRLARINKQSQVEVVTCKRPHKSNRGLTESEELFGLVLGGYGLFGIVTECTLEVADNRQLVLDSLTGLSLVGEEGQQSEFERVYHASRNDPTVEMKLARLNIINLETASLYLFRKSNVACSNLDLVPNEMSYTSQLLYKWALPLLKQYRQYAEDTSGSALDMPGHNYETTRNDVLWESALPLAKLYSPLVICNDTFILQEFFVPIDRFREWIQKAKPIYQDIDDLQRSGSGYIPAQSIILLNTTIRFVEKDESTLLAYSRNAGGSFAFVLYYRINRSSSVEGALGAFHNRFAKLALDLGGTYYLPYRRCYSDTLLEKGYPQLATFATKKESYDPMGVFSNEWFGKYLLKRCSQAYQRCWTDAVGDISLQVSTHSSGQHISDLSKEDFLERLPRRFDPTLERRTDSYRSLMRDLDLRKQFCDEFLVNVFNVADAPELTRMIARVASDPRNVDDGAIFGRLLEHIREHSSPVKKLREGFRSIRQLSKQKAELTDQTASILHRLGRFGTVQNYLSIGDHGKTIFNFLEAGIFDTSVETQVVVVHDFEAECGPTLSSVLERRSLDQVGDVSVQYNYVKDEPLVKFSGIESNSIDLATLNQGLHHFPADKLYDFLLQIRRVLRDDGIFILREHDLRLKDDDHLPSVTSAPVAMLDLAHSIFNAVTGVSKEEEQREIRAFRPLHEWRTILRLAGFEDTLLCGVEDGDSTHDFMLCFRKNGFPMVRNSARPSELAHARPSTVVLEPPLMKVVKALLDQVPSAVVENLSGLVAMVVSSLPSVIETVSTFLKVRLPSALLAEMDIRKQKSKNVIPKDLMEALTSLVRSLAETFSRKLEEILRIAIGAQDLLEGIHVRETSNIAGLLSTPELWLVLPALKQLQMSQPESVGDLETRILLFVESHIPVLFALEDTSLSDAVIREFPSQRPEREDVVDSMAPFAAVVDKQEVLDAIVALGEAIPDLRDPSVLFAESGFTISQQSALLSATAAHDPDGLAEKIAYYHDGKTWSYLRAALVGDGDSVRKRRDLPTKERLLSKVMNHPWHQALKCFLAGPRVQLKTQAKFGLRLVGLPELMELYDEVKKNGHLMDTHLEQKLNLSREEFMILNHRVAQLCQPKTVHEVSFRFDVSAEHDLFNVAEIVSARYGYVSLTSRLTDVTNDLKAFHEELHLDLTSRSADGSGNGRLLAGWLPLRESTLNSFRNKAGVTRLGDSMRKAVVTAGTLGMKGNSVLKLQYIPLATGIEHEIVDNLCSFAREKGLVDPDLHTHDGHYTWLKLSEWMQVEVMDMFTKSLNHTPWYHFPFMDFLSTYFRILFKECQVVVREHGLVEAYGSMAFATDLVPGIVMACLFGQLQLLAYPLKLYLPSYDPPSMNEEILMTSSSFPSHNLLENLQQTVDPRIQRAKLLCQPRDCPGGLYKVVVPTFKAMSEILVRIGECHPSARVLQVSNQKTIQVCLVADLDEPKTATASQAFVESLVAEISEMQGLEVMFQYRYPMDVQVLREAGEEDSRTVHLAVKAYAPYLLDLVRLVAQRERVRVKQIYDFYSG